MPYHLDERLLELDVPVEADETITLELAEGLPWRRMAVLYDTVADVVAAAVKDGEVPYVYSGDCTTSFGTVAGLQRAGIDPSIVWFDAHGDVHTPQTTLSGYLGGMPLRLLTGACPEVIAVLLGLRPVPEEKITLVDARDLDDPEAAYLEGSAITHCEIGDLVVPEGPIYLHVDFDVVDPEQVPGLLFPAKGGPSLKKVARAVRKVLDSGRVVAFGGACTWAPGQGAGEAVRPIMTGL
ncbi:arginase family protein [Actinocorallia longicatena]|uniref:arginase family protein n=1 Tax=Actinocorallia longicatena TaxID=111803 RepID=UPI0031D716FD